MISRILYGSHPASRVSMTDQDLAGITRDSLVSFHKAHYVPDHAVLAIAGDLSMADARKIIDARLAAWKKAGTPAPAVADPGAAGAAKVTFIARPNSVQSSLWIGTQGIQRTSPDYDIVQVTNNVLGGGPTGRLFTHLREEKGYTYGAYSSAGGSQYRGTWIASLDVRTEVTEPALRDLVAEITRMRNEPVPAKEFEDRKRGMVASFALVARVAGRGAEQPRDAVAVQAARRLLGQVPGARHGGDPGGRAGRGEEVSGSVAAPDRRRRRSDEGRRPAEAVRPGRDVRYERQTDRAMRED